MKNQTHHHHPHPRGFALIVTLSLMILLTVIAVGLLSLATISLRTSGTGEAQARASANARMAVILAIGELQKHAGDDRRITADASISATANADKLNTVGVWNSWSPKFVFDPSKSTAPAYAVEKTTNQFRTWLVSTPVPQDLTARTWTDSAFSPAPGSNPVKLFSLAKSGFELSGLSISAPKGTFAWGVSQENTRAKVNIAGPDAGSLLANGDLQAQARPSLALSSMLKDPANGWNLRSGRVISNNQVTLDKDLTLASAAIGAAYTVHAQGLLTNAVDGGLRTDLNLGFELGDTDFAADSWSGTPNPFRAANNSGGFSGPASYQGEQPIFKPLTDNPIVPMPVSFWPANADLRLYAAGVPTFNHLRSFYRIPYHLYGSAASPVVAERGPGHRGIKIQPIQAGYFPEPSDAPSNLKSQTSIRPVLNRVLYLLRPGATADNKGTVIITPVISLWNPYNVSLEIGGAVVYPWMDVPFNYQWTTKTGTTGSLTLGSNIGMAGMMGSQFAFQGHGRTIDPYFFCRITSDGSGGGPIRFQPGEVRVFAPLSATPVLFNKTATNANRTIAMREVNSAGDLLLRGGLYLAMNGQTINTTEEARLKITVAGGTTGSYNYFVTMEDSKRVANPNAKGEVISEIHGLKFVSEGITTTESPFWSNATLKAGLADPFAVLETYHRVARQPQATQPVADLIYTTNPRQASINHKLANGKFTDDLAANGAPHYRSSLRDVGSVSGVLETTSNGRNSFWGPTQSQNGGKTHLPFFEVPRQPLLSLAAFQSADLSSSTFSPAHQFANSWASPWMSRTKTSAINPNGVPLYDTVYLANESLWDRFFFSGAAPVLSPASSGNPNNAWNSDIATATKSLKSVLTNFVASPLENPLGNPRMRLVRGTYDNNALVDRLIEPAGCTRIAAHLTVDGAFNINSTNTEAWQVTLAGLRGKSFDVIGGTSPASDTAFPRFRFPNGTASDAWNGFRKLSDAEIKTLAQGIVDEVKKRGPFLSLAEFVNRRVEDSNLGNSGAIQAAIDAKQLNDGAKQVQFDTSKYPADALPQIIKDTGVGIPGYLTQADVLQSLAPVITCRSDTFTIRGYGEAKDESGKVIAKAWYEAVVQRMPDFVDPANPPETALASTNQTNRTFGRRFNVVSFRRLSSSEIL